eukprot:g81687.t1
MSLWSYFYTNPAEDANNTQSSDQTNTQSSHQANTSDHLKAGEFFLTYPENYEGRRTIKVSCDGDNVFVYGKGGQVVVTMPVASITSLTTGKEAFKSSDKERADGKKCFSLQSDEFRLDLEAPTEDSAKLWFRSITTFLGTPKAKVDSSEDETPKEQVDSSIKSETSKKEAETTEPHTPKATESYAPYFHMSTFKSYFEGSNSNKPAITLHIAYLEQALYVMKQACTNPKKDALFHILIKDISDVFVGELTNFKEGDRNIRREACFSIISPDYTIHLEAASADEAKSWLAELHKAISAISQEVVTRPIPSPAMKQ